MAGGRWRVALTHWDKVFRSLDREPRALPHLGDDVDVTLRVLDELATRSAVSVHVPTVWQREDPWA